MCHDYLQQPGVLSAVLTEGKCWVHLSAECGWVVACSGHWAATEWSPGAVCTLDTVSNTSPDAIHGNCDNILHQDLGPALLIMQPNTQRRMTADTGWGLWWGTMLHSKYASQWPVSGQSVPSQCPVSGRTGAPTQILDQWGIYFIIWLTVALHVSFIVLVCKSFIRKEIHCNIVSSVQVYVMLWEQSGGVSH